MDDPKTPEGEMEQTPPEESDLQRAFTNARRRSSRITDAVRQRVADIRDATQHPDGSDRDG